MILGDYIFNVHWPILKFLFWKVSIQIFFLLYKCTEKQNNLLTFNLQKIEFSTSLFKNEFLKVYMFYPFIYKLAASPLACRGFAPRGLIKPILRILDLKEYVITVSEILRYKQTNSQTNQGSLKQTNKLTDRHRSTLYYR